MSICLVPISPSAQIFIFPKSQFAQVPIYLLRCSFAPNAHLPQVSVYSKFSISSKYPFTVPRCPCAIVPIISLNPHLSRCPFAPNAHLPQVPNCLGPKCLGSICPGLKCTGPNYVEPFILVPICLLPKCTGPNCPRPICLVPIYPGARLSWCPFVRDPNVQKPPATPHTSI